MGYRLYGKEENKFIQLKEGRSEIRVSSGEIYIGDPCFLFRDSNWGKFLVRYNFCKHLPTGSFAIETSKEFRFYKVCLDLRRV